MKKTTFGMPQLVLLSIMLLAGCSGLDQDPYANLSAKQIFDNAKLALDSGEFAEAIKLFEALEARYPFGRYALQAQLDLAYAYYKHQEPDSAIATCNRFIKLNPRHPHVDYAWYLKGLSTYNKGRGFFESLSPRDFSELDQSQLLKAYRDFETLVTLYPDSRYREDARQRMIYIRNKMAEHELQIAQFYFRRGALIGSVNRSKYLLQHYDGAPVVPDALALMVRAYRGLNLEQLAAATLDLLKHNYPEHPALVSLLSPPHS